MASAASGVCTSKPDNNYKLYPKRYTNEYRDRAMEQSLTIETFLAASEMLAAQLRIKDTDRWSSHICKLKYCSFTNEFPEVNDAQFLWASEQWIQATAGTQFLRYPTWKELMNPLYRVENGLANRSWGFKNELPGFIAPSHSQIKQLPTQPKSVSPAVDPTNPEAYITVGSAGEAERNGLALQARNEPPLLTGSGLTEERWQQHLRELEQSNGEDDLNSGDTKDPGEGS